MRGGSGWQMIVALSLAGKHFGIRFASAKPFPTRRFARRKRLYRHAYYLHFYFDFYFPDSSRIEIPAPLAGGAVPISILFQIAPDRPVSAGSWSRLVRVPRARQPASARPLPERLGETEKASLSLRLNRCGRGTIVYSVYFLSSSKIVYFRLPHPLRREALPGSVSP